VSRYKTLVGGKTAAQKDLDDFIRLQAVAKDELQALRVQEMILREHLTRYAIKGPAGWRVIERFAEPGEWISVGQQVGTIGDFRTLMVPFALTEEEYGRLKERAKGLNLKFPDGRGAIPARISRVSPDFDPQTRKILVELQISGGLPEMRGGVRLELNLRSPDPAGVVLLPRQAVMERYEEHFVLSPDAERIKVVYAGAADHGLVRVMSPRLKPGDRVRLTPKP
jgi:multidrug efflux pump subunit AcrA (membrane-fusion protein)